jgi:hypothetical protein
MEKCITGETAGQQWLEKLWGQPGEYEGNRRLKRRFTYGTRMALHCHIEEVLSQNRQDIKEIR